MSMIHTISPDFIDLDRIKSILYSDVKLQLSEESKKKILDCRNYLDEKIARSKSPIYGINTGFGSLCDTSIEKQDLHQLQVNLVMSHACGMGDKIATDQVKLMLLLKIQGLSLGHSGVQLATVQRLVDFYNEGVYPIVYELGSLGASGDLAPLAHLALPIIGMGEVIHQGKRCTGEEIGKKFNWEPIKLMSKEGLALLNGTQFMSAMFCHSLIKLERLSEWADRSAACSLDAFDGRIEAFDELIQQVRPHLGQIETAKQIRVLLEGSEIVSQDKVHVQDPYCLRCVPQVHGASKDAIRHAKQVLETEMNSVTDNPTVFEEADKVISAGNFHGQALAIVMDYLAIAAAELASISERRIYKLLSGQRGLPAFLVDQAGLNSGFMIAQYAAASAVSQNKQLAHPASVDTIDSSNGQEDHVSMGANAATKLARVIRNLELVISTEWMTACQALEFRDKKTSPTLQRMIVSYRKEVPFIAQDTIMYPLISQTKSFLEKYSA